MESHLRIHTNNDILVINTHHLFSQQQSIRNKNDYVVRIYVSEDGICNQMHITFTRQVGKRFQTSKMTRHGLEKTPASDQIEVGTK